MLFFWFCFIDTYKILFAISVDFDIQGMTISKANRCQMKKLNVKILHSENDCFITVKLYNLTTLIEKYHCKKSRLLNYKAEVFACIWCLF